MTLDKEALNLHGRLEVWRFEESIDFLTKLRRFFNVVEMFIPVFCRIRQQMMVLYLIFRSCDPLLRLLY